MKEHRDRAPADVGPRHLNCCTGTAAAGAALKTVCKKLLPVPRSMFLQIAAPAGAGHRHCRAKQDQAVHAVRVPSTGAADAGTLHAVTIRSRTLAEAAISEGSASLMTDHMPACLALTEVLVRLPSEQQVMVVRRKWTTTALLHYLRATDVLLC